MSLLVPIKANNREGFKMEKGFVLYRGPSLLDGASIVVIATMKTKNVKTGNMIQTWIMREDIAPHTAAKQGVDYSVCGDCIHRPENQSTCYVTLFQAPLQIWKAYHAGVYSNDLALFESLLPGRKLRIGAYGDPAAVPADVWIHYANLAMSHTGYTHQMAHKAFDKRLLQVAMASADTKAQAEQYTKKGIRYFRVVRNKTEKIPGEIECLADSKKMSCSDCGVCNGSGRGKGKSIYITVHGKGANNFNPDIIAVA